MSLNCNELDLVLSELDLAGSFIQEVVQPGYDVLCLRTVRGGQTENVLVCTGASVCRIHSSGARATKNAKPLRFHEFLRARVQGMRINECRQLGLDRIVRLDVSTWQERLFIYVRLWSGAANVIVTDEAGTILDCMYRRPKRGEVSGTAFTVQEQVPSAEEREAELIKFPVRDFAELRAPWEEAHPGGDFDALTFNQKVDLYYSEHAASLSRESLLAQAHKWYEARHERMQGALDRLLQKEAQFAGADALRHTGDLLLAYGQQELGTGPAGTTAFDCTDYETGAAVHIRLDARKTVQENAATYYEQYKKAVSGREDLQHDIALSRRNLAALEEEYAALLRERNVIRLEQLLRRGTTPRQKEAKPHPGLHYELDGWTIMVGRTAAENDDLLRHYVRGNDLWLHARDFAGGYVFIKARRDKTVPLDVLLSAGNLAVWHSKARRNGQADLYYTQVKYLRRAKNGPKGLVLPTHEKNLLVRLDQERLRRLDGAGV